ncbi:WXG100 family type VII secretion target [Streptomyces sp. NPDC001617]
MPSNYFAVNPDGLAKNAPNVRAFSDQMRQVVGRLEERLGALGDCWGDDPMGKSFENVYQEPKEEMLTGLRGIVDVLDSTADGLETMAKGFHATEENNTSTARSFERGGDSSSLPKAPGDSSGRGSVRR